MLTRFWGCSAVFVGGSFLAGGGVGGSSGWLSGVHSLHVASAWRYLSCGRLHVCMYPLPAGVIIHWQRPWRWINERRLRSQFRGGRPAGITQRYVEFGGR